MKTRLTKRFFAFMLLLSGVFPSTFLNAQTCQGNKVWTCRTCTGPYGTTYQECDCVNANQVVTWQATPCSYYDSGNNGNGNNGGGGGHNYCDNHPCACICRIGDLGTGESSGSIYPNPLSNSTTIFFTINKTQNVSLKIFDVHGRLITTLADGEYSAGEHQVDWNASEVGAGVYFMKLESANEASTVSLAVVK